MAKRRKTNKPVADETTPDLPGPEQAAPERWTPSLLAAAACATVLIALILHIHHLLTRPPNFDEHIQLQFLWLTSEGILPRDGFLCPYPPTAYYLFGPLLHLVPQKPELFLFLRGCTLVPLAGLIASLAVMARHYGRRASLTVALLAALMAGGRFTALWEIRFDLLAWSLTMLAGLVLTKAARRRDIGVAAGLAFLSVLISPKHVCLVAGLAAGYGLWRLVHARRGLGVDVLVAIGAALTPVLAMLIVRPRFVNDILDLALMNYRTQLVSVYSETLPIGLLSLITRDPIATSVIWAGPVLFLLDLPRLSPFARFTGLGMLAGAITTLAILPCGYDQYLALAWAVFLPFAIWMTPRKERVGTGWVFVAACGLLVAVTLAREFPKWHEDAVAKQLKLQRTLALICPPGEVSASAPFTHAWFRRNVGYVFIDNLPSYREHVRPERKPLFGAGHFLQRLEEKPPAVFCNFTISDNQPPEYVNATVEYLSRHIDQYQLMHIACDVHPAIPNARLPVFVRKDRLPFIPTTADPSRNETGTGP